jgi:hypothetical protein
MSRGRGYDYGHDMSVATPISAFVGELFVTLFLLIYGLSLPAWSMAALALIACGLLLAKRFGVKIYLK